MEGTHRQLGAGLTDRLCRNNAHGLADVRTLTSRERTPVACSTSTDQRLTGEDGTDLDLLNARSNHRVEGLAGNIGALLSNNIAISIHHISGQCPRVRGCLQSFGAAHLTGLFVARSNLNLDATTGATVLFANDDVLRNVDQTTR